MVFIKKLRFLILGLFSIAVFITNVEPILAKSKNIVNPNQKYTYNKMVRDIKKLQKKYPKLIQVKIIGKSEYGRNIYAVGLGPHRNNPNVPSVFINGAHHGREWLTTNLNMNMLEQYAIAYSKNKKIGSYKARSILKQSTIWFVPMVNPDGVTLSQSGLKNFPKKDHKKLIKMNGGSKNFKRWKANGKGIDLNRQYNVDWKKVRNFGIKSPYYQFYKGKKAESATETKVLLKFVNQLKPTMAVSYHSTGKILYWNYKQNKTDKARDLKYAKGIRKLTGYRLMGDTSKSSAAGMTDWFIVKQKIPAFTIEIGNPRFESSVPISEFKRTWKENRRVGLYLANQAIKLDKQWKKVITPLQKVKNETAQLKANAEKPLGPNEKISSSFVKSVPKLKAKQPKLNKQLSNFKKLPPYRRAGHSFNSLPKNVKKEIKKAENYIQVYNRGEALLAQTRNFTANPTPAAAANLKKQLASYRATIPSLATKKVRTSFSTKFITPVEQALKSTGNL